MQALQNFNDIYALNINTLFCVVYSQDSSFNNNTLLASLHDFNIPIFSINECPINIKNPSLLFFKYNALFYIHSNFDLSNDNTLLKQLSLYHSHSVSNNTNNEYNRILNLIHNDNLERKSVSNHTTTNISPHDHILSNNSIDSNYCTLKLKTNDLSITHTFNSNSTLYDIKSFLYVNYPLFFNKNDNLKFIRVLPKLTYSNDIELTHTLKDLDLLPRSTLVIRCKKDINIPIQNKKPNLISNLLYWFQLDDPDTTNNNNNRSNNNNHSTSHDGIIPSDDTDTNLLNTEINISSINNDMYEDERFSTPLSFISNNDNRIIMSSSNKI